MSGFFVHPCQACGEKIAPWGYHGKFFCDSHRDRGEALMTAAPAAGAPALPPPIQAQGRLL